MFRFGMQVVVATPGRLWELMRGGHAHLTALGGLRFLVLDEADRMVQKGHFQVTPCMHVVAGQLCMLQPLQHGGGPLPVRSTLGRMVPTGGSPITACWHATLGLL